MKNAQQQTGTKPAQNNANRNRPENKDNLDSRKNEEQDFKGDDVTHNEKEHRTEPKKKKEEE
jgi:hypothetical protein